MHCVSEKKGIPSHKDEEGPISGLGLQLEPSLRFRLRLGFSLQNGQALGSQGQGLCKVGYRFIDGS